MNKEKENKNAEISARIAEILQYTGETRNSFAVKLGYERAQTVYDIMNMKSAPSYDFFNRFSLSEYSDIINIKWLLSGVGSMLCNNQHQELTQSTSATQLNSSSGEAAAYYKMYKDKDEENKALLEKIGGLKERIRQLESQDKKPDHYTKISETPDSEHGHIRHGELPPHKGLGL